MIRQSGAEIVFIGIGAPKQERWMAEHCRFLPGVTLLGVGAAFDFHAGRIPQAPPWMQNIGLEWFFRLCSEPRRLWRRYLLETPFFLPLWTMQKIGLLRYHLAQQARQP
jgi:N-acetylglucosaminyldiphosphoundecaprenol N-acetyl-beta-D-mannosaminyltransferase